MEQSKNWRRLESERTSTSIWENPDRGEEQIILRAESDVSSVTPRQDSSVLVKLGMISGLFQAIFLSVRAD